MLFGCASKMLLMNITSDSRRLQGLLPLQCFHLKHCVEFKERHLPAVESKANSEAESRMLVIETGAQGDDGKGFSVAFWHEQKHLVSNSSDG